MRKQVLIIISLFFCLNLFSQQKEIDSLLAISQKLPADSNTLNIYTKIIEICDTKDNIKYGTAGVQLCEQLIANAKNQAEKEKYLRKKIYFLMAFRLFHKEENNFEEVEKCDLQIIALAKETKNKYLIDDKITALIDDYLSVQKVTAAVNFAYSALKEAEKKGDKMEALSYLGQLSSIYSRIRNHEKMLKYQLLILKTSEEMQYTEGIPWILQSVGMGYLSLEKPDTALVYFLRSYELLKDKLNNRENLRIFYRLASALGKMGEHEKARAYLLNAVSLLETKKNFEAKDSLIKGAFYSEIGQTYYDEKKYEQALAYKLKAIHLIGNLSDGDAFKPNLTTGIVYAAVSDYQLALKYALKAKKIADERHDLYNQNTCNKLLADWYKKTGNEAAAKDFLLAFYVTKDSMDKIENAEEVLAREMNYENEKNESLLKAEQEKQSAIHKEEQEKQRVITYSVVAGLLLTAVFAVFVLSSLRKSRVANKIIAQQKTEVEAQKHLVDEKQKELLDSIRYARRIQRSLLPTEKYIVRSLRELRTKK